MSNINLHNINSLTADAYETLSAKKPVLFVTPTVEENIQQGFIQHKYGKLLFRENSVIKNNINYSTLKPKKNLLATISQKINEVYTHIRFMFLLRTEIKKYSAIHLFVFSTVSFLFQIIPLVILGKFYRKNVVVEFYDFKNYYLPEESKTYIRFFLQHADRVIVPSGRQSRALKQKMVDAYSFTTKFDAREITARTIERVQPHILVSAFFESVFNFNSLLEAYIRVKQKYPRTELTLLGRGSQKDAIEEIIAQRRISGVSIVESDPDNELYESADIFVHSYHIEYFAQDILKAMAYGIPVISSPLGMVKNLVQDENILMYQFNDFSTLADNILALIENDTLTQKLSEQSALYARKSIKSSSDDDILLFYKNLTA